MLIQGDNLEALKSLLPYYAGKVKCIYIDPPFGTGREFENYDDNLKHALWLGMINPRLEFLRDLLSNDGSIFVHLDDSESDYAKVLLDEVFGRTNFVQRVTVRARSPSAFSTVNPGVFKASEYILWYARKKEFMDQSRVWVARPPDTAYNKWLENPSDPEADWQFSSIRPVIQRFLENRSGRSSVEKATVDFYVENAAQITRLAEIDDDGAGEDIVDVKRQSLRQPAKIFRHSRNGFEDIFITQGQQILFYSKNIREIDGVRTPARMLTNIWDDIPWEGIAREGGVTLRKGKKPERLIRRCLQLVTRKHDLVLDSFLGSGTTVAVAHKMDRRWIGIERGDHAVTHCAPRMGKVIEGEQGGISQTVGWQGGGGFSFYRLGDAIFDTDGKLTPGIKFAPLAAHVWFSETGLPLPTPASTPFLGHHNGSGYALLYNGVLGDKRPQGGNVLTNATLALIREATVEFAGPIMVYGESSRLSAARLKAENIVFKQTPYDVKAR